MLWLVIAFGIGLIIGYALRARIKDSWFGNSIDRVRGWLESIFVEAQRESNAELKAAIDKLNDRLDQMQKP